MQVARRDNEKCLFFVCPFLQPNQSSDVYYFRNRDLLLLQ
jgi:hypothetical protein